MLRRLPITRVPLKIAGANKFGRYPKISAEKTYNMFISDGWLVPTPGYLKIVDIDPLAEGRGIFTSIRGNFMLTVIGSGVWIINDEIYKFGRTIPVGDASENIGIKVGDIDTFSGDVFIDENDADQIGICDKKDIYIYDYQNNTFQKAATPGSPTLDFLPGFITSQDGRLIAPDLQRPQWRLSEVNNGHLWPATAANVGSLQTKPDNARACIRVPGHGNQLFVMGSSVTESWNDVGYKLFPYYRTNSFNIDYGCINQATVAAGDEFVVWLAKNEKSSPVIMLSTGGKARPISTDGINFALANLKKPENCYGFLWKQDGRLFYQLTFPYDKVTHLYDFKEDKFYFLSDEYTDNHIAKKVTFFANDYYFISLIDGNIYRLSGDLGTYDGKLIPRIRIPNTIRLPGGEHFVGQKAAFTMEQGESANVQRIDASISYDGGVAFGNIFSKELNPLGKRINKFNYHDLGRANDLTFQFRFWGEGRFVCADGYVDIYRGTA